MIKLFWRAQFLAKVAHDCGLVSVENTCDLSSGKVTNLIEARMVNTKARRRLKALKKQAMNYCKYSKSISIAFSRACHWSVIAWIARPCHSAPHCPFLVSASDFLSLAWRSKHCNPQNSNPDCLGTGDWSRRTLYPWATQPPYHDRCALTGALFFGEDKCESHDAPDYKRHLFWPQFTATVAAAGFRSGRLFAHLL